MRKIEFSIMGDPIAKKRPRFFAKKMKSGKVFKGSYNAQETDEGKFIQKVIAQLPMGFQVINEPVYVSMFYGVKRPKAHFGTGRNAGKIKASAPEYPGGKPDIDNCEKFIFDCFNGVVWRDDSLVIKCLHSKGYVEEPCTHIIIELMARPLGSLKGES